MPQLLAAGHTVFGLSRSPERAALLQRLGAVPVILDIYDRDALIRAICDAQPHTVMHQMTDLPQTLAGGGLSEEMLASNARVRIEGGSILVDAALAAGADSFVAQSLAWLYAPVPQAHGPYTEQDPLDLQATGPTAISVGGVVALESLTLHSSPLRGVVLRYGMLYGPGTWSATANGNVPVHVDAAAYAAALAVASAASGIFNIAEERGLVSAEKARRELGWQPDYRLADDAAGAMRRPDAPDQLLR